FPAFPSNCVLPAYVYAGVSGLHNGSTTVAPSGTPIPINVGAPGGGQEGGCELAYLYGVDPVTQLPYVADPTVTKPGSGAAFLDLAARPGYPGFDPLDESVFQHNRG